jgi:hypothetical protein
LKSPDSREVGFNPSFVKNCTLVRQEISKE